MVFTVLNEEFTTFFNELQGTLESLGLHEDYDLE